MINDLPDASNYTGFAYQTALLKDFVSMSKEERMRDSETGDGDGGPIRRHSYMAKRLSFKKHNTASSMRSLTKRNGGFQAGSGEIFKSSGRKQRAQSVLIKGL